MGVVAGQLQLHDFVEAAACATINERCAKAYLHDVRGTMQAVYSALELLGRSARATGDNAVKIEKACNLARRAVTNHEKSMLAVMQHLTPQRGDIEALDIADVVDDVILLLRNDAAQREITVRFDKSPTASISTDRNKLYVVLVGLLANAIDEVPSGTELTISLTQQAGFVNLSVASAVVGLGYAEFPELTLDATSTVRARDLAIMFARRFLQQNGGELASVVTAGKDSLSLVYPANPQLV